MIKCLKNWKKRVFLDPITHACFAGIFVTERDDESFHHQHASTMSKLSHQLSVCASEECALRVLREEECEEMENVEKQKRKLTKQNRELNLSKRIELIIQKVPQTPKLLHPVAYRLLLSDEDWRVSPNNGLLDRKWHEIDRNNEIIIVQSVVHSDFFPFGAYFQLSQIIDLADVI